MEIISSSTPSYSCSINSLLALIISKYKLNAQFHQIEKISTIRKIKNFIMYNFPFLYSKIYKIKSANTHETEYFKNIDKDNIIYQKKYPRSSWTYNKDMDDWILSDGVPCYDCVKFCEMNKFREFIISTKDDTKIKKVNLEYLKKNTKKSTGRLYSSGNKY